jgi:hypothetical protein
MRSQQYSETLFVKEYEAMLKVIRMASLILLLSITATAQSKDGPHVELFNGYSHAFGGNGDAPGWLTSVTVNRSRYHGFFGEFSRHYRAARINLPDGEIKNTSGFNILLFGIQVYIKKQNPVTPFLRLTIGGWTENTPTTFDGKPGFNYAPELTLGAGGGVDVKLSDRFAFRAFQLDHLNAGQNKPKRVRLSTGLVVRF